MGFGNFVDTKVISIQNGLKIMSHINNSSKNRKFEIIFRNK